MSRPDFERFEQALPELLRAAGWRGESASTGEAPAPQEIALWENLMDAPAAPARRPRIVLAPAAPLWGTLVAAALVAAVGVGVYQRTLALHDPPSINRAGELATNLQIYGDNLGAALEAVTTMPGGRGVTTIEVALRLRQAGVEVAQPPRILSSGGPLLDRTSLKAFGELQQAGLLPWQGSENLVARYQFRFDAAAGRVFVSAL